MPRRVAFVLTAVAAAGCSHATRPQTATEPAPGSVRAVEQVFVPHGAVSMSRGDSASARVDTLVVSPDSFVVRRGESISIMALHIVGRTRTGEQVVGFYPEVGIEDRAILGAGAQGYVALRPGRTRLVVRPGRDDPRLPPFRAVTYVSVSVLP